MKAGFWLVVTPVAVRPPPKKPTVLERSVLWTRPEAMSARAIVMLLEPAGIRP